MKLCAREVDDRSPARLSAVLASVTLLLAAVPGPQPLLAQEATEQTLATEANYQQAGRFAPYKIRELLYSTSVAPRWIEDSERFWYEWRTSDGSTYYIVDPVRGTKGEIFDNDRIAAELTRITRDPWDGKHLPIRAIKFIDENTLQFEVESSQDEEDTGDDDDDDELDDEELEEDRQQRERRQRADKKVFHFEYTVSTRTLRELEDWEAPDNHPAWASVSPDGQTIIFAKQNNLYKMTAAEYQKILDARRGESGDEADDAEEDVEVEETQLTTDGEQYYSYAGGRVDFGDTDNEKEENKDDRKRTSVTWSKDSGRFAFVRSDRRESQELWVIHSVGNTRPELFRARPHWGEGVSRHLRMDLSPLTARGTR